MNQHPYLAKPELRMVGGDPLGCLLSRIHFYDAQIAKDTNEPISSPCVCLRGKSPRMQEQSYLSPDTAKKAMHTNEPISSPLLRVCRKPLRMQKRSYRFRSLAKMHCDEASPFLRRFLSYSGTFTKHRNEATDSPLAPSTTPQRFLRRITTHKSANTTTKLPISLIPLETPSVAEAHGIS
jgi:hypothetical protein